MLPPPDISAAYVDVQTGRPTRDFFNWIKALNLWVTGGGRREILTGDTTYFVSTTGSDVTGDGSAGKPWQTLDNANSVLAETIDGGGHKVFIQVADGTYSSTYPGQIPNVSQLVVQGHSGDATKVIIQDDGYAGFDVNQGGPMGFFLEWLTLQQANGGTPFIMDAHGGNCIIGNCILDGGAGNSFGLFIQGSPNSLSFGFDHTGAQVPNTIKGNFSNCLMTLGLGYFTHGGVTTIVGTPNFTGAFLAVNLLSSYNEAGSWVNGASATGKRYDVQGNSVVQSSGGGPNLFPGNVAGTTSTGGQYL
jgi:hypothetical protein